MCPGFISGLSTLLCRSGLSQCVFGLLWAVSSGDGRPWGGPDDTSLLPGSSGHAATPSPTVRGLPLQEPRSRPGPCLKRRRGICARGQRCAPGADPAPFVAAPAAQGLRRCVRPGRRGACACSASTWKPWGRYRSVAGADSDVVGVASGIQKGPRAWASSCVVAFGGQAADVLWGSSAPAAEASEVLAAVRAQSAGGAAASCGGDRRGQQLPPAAPARSLRGSLCPPARARSVAAAPGACGRSPRSLPI